MQILELDTVQRAFGNKAVLGFDVCITEQVRILECIKNKGGNEFLSKLYMNTQDTFELYVIGQNLSGGLNWKPNPGLQIYSGNLFSQDT